VNRRGRQVICSVNVTPLLTRQQEIHGAILVMEEALPRDHHENGTAAKSRATARKR
jgi:hypothetical protein